MVITNPKQSHGLDQMFRSSSNELPTHLCSHYTKSRCICGCLNRRSNGGVLRMSRQSWAHIWILTWLLRGTHGFNETLTLLEDFWRALNFEPYALNFNLSLSFNLWALSLKLCAVNFKQQLQLRTCRSIIILHYRLAVECNKAFSLKA